LSKLTKYLRARAALVITWSALAASQTNIFLCSNHSLYKHWFKWNTFIRWFQWRPSRCFEKDSRRRFVGDGAGRWLGRGNGRESTV